MVVPWPHATAGVVSALLVGLAAGVYVASRPTKCSCTKSTTPKHSTKPRTPKHSPPKRLILVRHGQSQGNLDSSLYCHVPDNAIHITHLGMEEARAAGRSIRAIIGDESVRFIVSPYVRTIETFQGILEAWGAAGSRIPWTEEPRIREQDFGNFQEPLKIQECKAQRERFGSFFYRFPSGESPADVYDRISSFLESLFRLFRKTTEQNYVLVTHGVAIRVLLTRFFKYRVCEFEQLQNFHNAEFVVLEYDKRTQKYELHKVIANRVVLDSDNKARVVSVEEADTLRVYDNSKPMVQPYPSSPSSPTNHFRRCPVSFPSSTASPSSIGSTSSSVSSLVTEELPTELPVKVVEAAAKVMELRLNSL